MHTIKPNWRTIKPWDRHAMTLTVAGVIYFAVGVTMNIKEPSDARSEILKMALDIMPYSAWGAGFGTVGIFTVISSRWPAIPKSLGYSLLTGWSVLWAGFNLVGGISTGTGSYIANGFVWCMIAFLWWDVSGFVSLPKVRKSSGHVTTSGCPVGSFDRGGLYLFDAEASLARSKSELEGESPCGNGDRSV